MENNITKQVKLDIKSLPTISICMITKNEEENLKRLLPILHKSIDEIIIVDTGSTDNTVEIAKKYTDQVYFYQWNNDFSKARNESLKYATKDYILWLDADDLVAKQDIAKLRFHLKNNEGTAVFLDLLDRRVEQEFKAKQLRVFPNHKEIEFRGKVHEQISFSIEEKDIQYSECDMTILHLGYISVEKIKEKLERNLSILIEDLKDNPNDYLLNLNIGKSYVGMLQTEKAKPYINKCIKLIESGLFTGNKEHALLSYISNSSICLKEGNVKQAIEDLERVEHRFFDSHVYRLLIGELYFRDKQYRQAYKSLFFLTEGRIKQGVIPLDYKQTVSKLTKFLFFSALNIGDLDTAEQIAKIQIGDSNFIIKRS